MTVVLQGSSSTTTYLDDFIATVDQCGDKVAVCSDHEELTYAQLYVQVVSLAAYLQSVLPDEHSLVGICLPRTPKLLVSMLAVQMAGHAYVPIDPQFPQRRIQLILEDAGVEVLLSSKHVSLAELPSGIAVIQLDEIEIAEDGNRCKTEAPVVDLKFAAHCDATERLAYVIYTSGSTGSPKGVCISMGNLTNFLRAMLESPGIDPDARVLALTTVAFDIAQLELFLPLIAGARVYIAPRDIAVDGNALASYIERHRISLVQATPSTWRLLKLANWQGAKGLTALTGGEPINSELAGWIADKVSVLWNMYGPTETTVWSSCCQITSADISSGKIPIGTAIANTSLYIRRVDGELQDVDSLQSPEATEAGELLIGGLGVARGYHQRPELNAANFIPNRFTSQASATLLEHDIDQVANEESLMDPILYCTGDLVSADEQGRYYCHGRIDSQIKLRGYRIEPGEIESVLEGIETIERAAVCIQQHQGSDFLAAYIVTTMKDGTSVDDLLDQIEKRLAMQLPEYMMPRLYVSVESMPETPNAKLDRGALPEPGSHGSLVLSRSHAVASDTSGASVGSNAGSADASQSRSQLSPLENQVAAMWSELVGQPVLDTGSNFFEIGGHSLLAMRFISAARKKYNRGLPFRCMATDTLAEIASRLEQRERSSLQPGVEHLKTSRTGGFIHSGKRQVFHQIHRPLDRQIKGGLLVVPPLAHEHARIHRELFLLAEKLASRGFCVLRFDFSGTGHSALQSSELLLEDWYSDIRDGGDRLREVAGCADIDVLSVRAGGLLYAHAGLSLTGQKIIWDPVFSGAEHVEQLQRLTASATRDLDRYRWAVKDVPADEIMGQIYQPQLLSKLSGLRWANAEHSSSGGNLHLLGGSGSIELPEVVAVEGNTRKISVPVGQLHRVPDAINWDDPKQLDSIIVAPATLDAIMDLLL